jgi:hypothetical protein
MGLEHVDLLERLRDQEVQIGVALPVGVGAKVDGQAIDEERDVGAWSASNPRRRYCSAFPPPWCWLMMRPGT